MIEIIPAIDLIDGKCVRLSQGDYNQKKVYNENPLEVAKQFEGHGLKRLHLVDLDGAKAKHVVNHKTLEQIAKGTDLIIDFGGGIKSANDVKLVLESGASMVTVGSVAVTEPRLLEKWIQEYSPAKIILGADVKDGKIAIGGWLNVTDINLNDFLTTYKEKGIINVLCTDISKDGMLEGSSIQLYSRLIKEFPGLNIIASGGVSSIDEIRQLDKMGMPGVIVGKAIYEGRISLPELGELQNV